jgi:hypothetical protein
MTVLQKIGKKSSIILVIFNHCIRNEARNHVFEEFEMISSKGLDTDSLVVVNEEGVYFNLLTGSWESSSEYNLIFPKKYKFYESSCFSISMENFITVTSKTAKRGSGKIEKAENQKCKEDDVEKLTHYINVLELYFEGD